MTAMPLTGMRFCSLLSLSLMDKSIELREKEAAAAKAAAWMLLTGRRKESVTLDTPKGIRLNLTVREITMGEKEVSCAIEKDGGDDVDVTTGLPVIATVELLPVGSKPFIPHVLEFYYLLNDGMSFSMLSGKRTLLVIITGVMLAVLAGMLLLRKMPRLERAAWILVVGGGVGNLIDRIRTGVVVDYLNCLFINFPVFNFADVCICVGVGLLVLSLLLDMRREQKAKQQKGSAPTDGTA